MTTTPPESPQPARNALVEVLGLALLLLGVASVGVAAFAVDWRLGAAVVGSAAAAAGARLTFGEA